MYKLYNDFQQKIVENQDLYRNKDDFRFFLKQKVMYMYSVYKVDRSKNGGFHYH